MRTQIPWLRVGAEGLVIVVSILLAFGIDAWWARATVRSDERESLHRLEEEFQTNAEGLAYSREAHQSRYDAAARLMRLTGPSVGRVADWDAVAADIRTFRARGVFAAPNGVLTSLISSGQITLISNPELRSALSAWPDWVEHLNREELGIARLVEEEIVPYLTRTTSLVSLYHSAGADFVPEASTHPADLVAVLQDREFENLLLTKQGAERLALRQVASLQDRLDHILGLLADELGA